MVLRGEVQCPDTSPPSLDALVSWGGTLSRNSVSSDIGQLLEFDLFMLY